MPPILSRERMVQIEKAALAAWMKRDSEALQAAVEPIFTEGNTADGLMFLLDLVVVTYGPPQGDGNPITPVVGTYNPDGTVGPPQDITEVPLGVRTYAQMAASYLSGDLDTAVALYTVLIEQTTSEALELCIQAALAQASRRARAVWEGRANGSHGPGADPASGYGSLQ